MRVLPFKIQITKIEPNLFLGSIEDAYDVKKLLSLNVTHVLNMATEIPNFYENTFTYKKVNGKDVTTFQMHKHFDEVADFIHEAMQKGKVFVHCYCGISRSTTAIIAYMIKYRSSDPKRVYESIRKKRWIVCPNDGFMRQLCEYYRAKCLDPAEKTEGENKKQRRTFTIKRVNRDKFPSIAAVSCDKVARNLRNKARSVCKENDSQNLGPLKVRGSNAKPNYCYGYFRN